MSNIKKFSIAVAIPLLILIGMVILPQVIVVFGQEVQLETKAVSMIRENVTPYVDK